VRIVVNADDFGFDDDTVAATIACFERGAITSATIMPRMPATDRAVEFARSRPDLAFGVHLTFAGGQGFGERPVGDPAELPQLVDGHGEFLDGRTVMQASVLHRLDPAPIAREMDRQIRSLVERGLALTHVDSHGHMHKSWAFVRALRDVLPRFGLTRVRRGQNVWMHRPYSSPTFWTGRLLHPRIERFFRTTDRFFMPTRPDEASRLPELLTSRTSGVLEVGVHPGYAVTWRDAERRGVEAFAAEIARSGHALTNWGAL
jgi:predicted glycoside hydrolase/deacetylase ChbG (UPF0249 family)